MTRLLITGPPGTGKGTQAAVLSAAFGVPAISTGEIFREQVRLQTDLGRAIESVMASGGYVSDLLTNAVVADRLHRPDAGTLGFVLDGYPRTVDQVTELDGMLDTACARLDAVVYLATDTEELVARLIRRGHDHGRADDTAAAIRQRIAVYTERTEPVIDRYRTRGLVVTVAGRQSVKEVSQTMLAEVTKMVVPAE